MKCKALFIILVIVAQISSASLVYTTREIILGDQRAKLHAAEFTLDDYLMKIVKANEGRLGSEYLVDMVERYNPVVAINGTFFKEYHGRLNGIPTWLLQSRGDIYATAGRYPVFFISGKTYGVIQTAVSPYIKINDEVTYVTSLNAPDFLSNASKDSQSIHILNNSYWHSTMTSPDTLELLYSKRGYQLEKSNKGNMQMPLQGFALISDAQKGKQLLEDVPHDAVMQYGVKYSASELADAEYIISGSDIIVQDGEVAKHIARYKGDSSFINSRHARTALCIRNDKSVGLYVAEDRAKKLHEEMSVKELLSQLQDLGYSMAEIRKTKIGEAFAAVRDATKVEYVGLTLREFAELLQEQNCHYALNLDGGSSSMMVYEGQRANIFGRIDNPDLVGMRNIGDAIMIFPKDSGKNN